MPTFNLLGTPLLATTYEQLIASVHELARSDRTHAIDFTNTHIVTLRRQDARFREITREFDHFVPDGMPLIWCLNARGAGLRDRVYGPTFMRRCLEASPAPWTHYLLGGSEECGLALQQKFSGARFIGTHHGYFSPNEEAGILAEINQLAPDFIWVGLGTPKQQDWIHRHKSQIRRGVLFAVGFAFDVNAGLKPDAPPWMQRLGLTWLFRVASEPGRLLTRYLRFNSLFLYYLLKDALTSPRA
ncbi:MAG: WecB/TagA/CpsF family glycosyltransferase [Chthoniobacterales bacterium]|nr:WecB/TagA/CpsF family glycosyltransferase [Chthoniobacterales bacterium]